MDGQLQTFVNFWGTLTYAYCGSSFYTYYLQLNNMVSEAPSCVNMSGLLWNFQSNAFSYTGTQAKWCVTQPSSHIT